MDANDHEGLVSEQVLIRRVKGLLAVVLLSLGLAHANDAAWPLVMWPMYARMYPKPPDRVTEIELSVVARDGSEFVLLPSQLFTQVHAELGRKVAAGAFSAEAEVGAYRRALWMRLQHVFAGTEIARVRARRATWDVEPRASPPFRICCPDHEEALGVLSMTEGSGQP